ncbi:hypothetical protein EMPS_03825 [Entomortierella parvispora]|uniref:Uncharacterized protein n=1 Tax=Entomortierella parvispora TaxID=205924 RepID=A0A9P3H7F9_9FUNG|nr:hypothetical protein EMPS_03825 [Entomortierella parvispora]
MLNILVRLILLFLIVAFTIGLQLTSLSNVINNRVRQDQNDLKNFINIYVTICGISFAVMVFVLGKLFTSDLSWHLREQPGSKRFIRAWGFYPGLISVYSGFRIGGKRWIMMGLALTLITCFSLVKDIWLTQAIQIKPHMSISEPLNVSVATLHGGVDALTTRLDHPGYLGVFAVEVVMGLKGSTALHSDGDGEYIWSPWLNDPQVSEIVIEDYSTIGLRPSCKLMTLSEVIVTPLGVPFYQIDIPETTFNASQQATLYIEGGPIYTTWNTTTVRSNATGHYKETTPDYIVNYHVFLSNVQYDNRTDYTFKAPKNATYEDNFLAFVYGCKVEISQYNISGHVVSDVGPTLDRLNMTKKVPVLEILDDTPNFYQMVQLASEGFTETLSYQNIGANIEICLPIQCWMADTALGINTGYNSSIDGPTTALIYQQGWTHMTPELLEYKVVQSIGYILSPTVMVDIEYIMAGNVTHDSVIETTDLYVYAGIGIELVLILLGLGFYICSVTDYGQGHGDDLEHLVAVLQSDGTNNRHELDTLTKSNKWPSGENLRLKTSEESRHGRDYPTQAYRPTGVL